MMVDQDDERILVTLPIVYRKLELLSENFTTFMASYEEREKHRADHEGRLQKLERWKAAVPASLITALLSAVLAIARF